jgi:hypothetical protein
LPAPEILQHALEIDSRVALVRLDRPPRPALLFETFFALAHEAVPGVDERAPAIVLGEGSGLGRCAEL